MCSIFGVRGKGLYEGFNVVLEKFRNSLCRMATARNDRTSGVALFVDARHLLLPSNPLFVKFLRFSPPLTAKTPSLCRPLSLIDVTQAFVTFWYTPRYKTTHLTRNNPPEFINATIRAVSPVLFSSKAKQITFSPQLVNKEKSLTTYPANPKILST